jgi:hypothetical protein
MDTTFLKQQQVMKFEVTFSEKKLELTHAEGYKRMTAMVTPCKKIGYIRDTLKGIRIKIEGVRDLWYNPE